MLLLHLDHNQWARMQAFNGDDALAAKLSQLGLRPGAQLQILRAAPLGGPFLVEVNGRSIAISRKIASQISVEGLCDSL